VNDYQADDESSTGFSTGFSTGDSEVDAALELLEELDTRPVDDHAAVYDEVHRRLGAVLAGTADGQPSGQ
jgi:hypothetical protein